MRQIVYILGFLLLVSTTKCKAQQVSLYGQYGFLVPHHDAIQYSVTDYISSAEAWYFPSRSTVDRYDSLYRYPLVGGGISFSTLSNAGVFGNAWTAAGYYVVPLGWGCQRLQWNYQLGFGLSYISRIFSFESNMPNVAIGSHWNVFVRLGLGYRFRISERLVWLGGINFTHFSNGKMGAPNLGLNTTAAYTGFNYVLSPSKVFKGTIPVLAPSAPVYVVYSAGIKYPGNFVQTPYFISSISVNAGFRRGYKGYPQAGLDVFMDKSLPVTMESNGLNSQPSDAFNLGAHIGYDAVYRRLMATVQVGYIMYSPYVELTRMYSRIGFRYAITPRLFGNIAIKAHYAVADFIEWGVGYYLTDKFWR